MPQHIDRIFFVVFFIALSFGAGALGGWLSSEISRVALLPDDARVLPIDSRPPSPVPTKNSLGEIAQRVRPSIVAIVKDLKGASAQDEHWSSRVVVRPSISAYAIALTADGWLVTPFKNLDAGSARFSVLDSRGQRSALEKVISDPALGVTFIKTVASDFRSASFSSWDAHAPAEAYRVAPNAIDAFTISSKIYPSIESTRDAIRSSDRLEKRLNADSRFEVAGLPVVDGQGALLGMTLQKGVIPVSYIDEAFDRILRNGSLARVTLELSYIDGYHTSLQQTEGTSGDSETGARLVSEAKTILIPTPSGAGRLQHWDRIVSVNGEVVDGNRSLSELVQGYQKGDTLTIAYQRGLELREIKLKL